MRADFPISICMSPIFYPLNEKKVFWGNTMFICGEEVRKYITSEHIKPILCSVTRILKVIGIISLFDVIGIGIFLLSKGQWNLTSFTELITILFLLEGSLICAVGAFMFLGYSEYRIARQAAINPAIASDQLKRWKERRASQKEWGVAMLIAGFLLTFLGLLVSLLTSL